MRSESYQRVERVEQAWKKSADSQTPAPVWHEFLEFDSELDFLLYVLEMDIEQRVRRSLPGLISVRYWEHPKVLGRLSSDQRISLVRLEVVRRLASLGTPGSTSTKPLEHEYANAFPELADSAQWQQIPWAVDDPGSIALNDTLPSARSKTTPLSAVSNEATVGPYSLVKKLAEGGMGEVWLADQKEPVRRRVALKLIKGSFSGSQEILNRFAAERQALALMNHPNIARILDAGSTEQGQPYFVMEYVPGLPFTEYCDQNQLSIDDRLRLFCDVCQGIQHAHQKAIIHRDLKPNNILVGELDQKAFAKIIDFGLAKALESNQRLTDKSIFTGVGQVLGTLKYMSPEQAGLSSTDIDTRTDVYALGVILYELLVGSTPLEDSKIRELPVLQILESIRLQEPQRPSSRLRSLAADVRGDVSQKRQIEAVRLQGILAGDLDWVVMKALEPNRDRRYSSVAELSDDVRNFLGGQPVSARPPSIGYRLAKFSRRQRSAIIVTSLISIGLLGTAWGLSRAWRAEEQAKQRAVANTFQVGLEESVWTEALADQQEQLATQISQFAPASGLIAREKLLNWTVELVRKQLRKAKVSDEDRKQLEPAVKWLTSRDALLSEKLRGEIETRFNDWQPALVINAPFENFREAFAATEVVVENDALKLGDNSADLVPTTFDTSSGRVKVSLDIDGDWQSANKIGLVFNYPGSKNKTNSEEPQNGGYEFSLTPAISGVPPRDAFAQSGDKPLPQPRNFRESKRSAILEISRNGFALQRKSVLLPQKSLTLAAEREGDKLRMFVDELPLEFTDDLPLTAEGSAVLAVHWPKPAVIRRLKVESKALPLAASPLEKADALFSREKYSEALEAYQLQQRSGQDYLEEATVKAGVCLARLNRPDDAVQTLEPLLLSKGERWPIIAATELWRIRLKQNDYTAAGLLLAQVKLKYTKEQLSKFVSISVREELAKTTGVSLLELIMLDPNTIPRLEEKLEIAELLDLPELAERYLGSLTQAYAVHGANQTAVDTADKLVALILPRFQIDSPLLTSEAFFYLARAKCWALRASNRTKEASDFLEQFMRNPLPDSLENKPSPEEARKIFATTLLEQARNHAALNDWQKAEADIERYFETVDKPIGRYMFYSQPYLMKGFLVEDKGQPEIAQEIWKKGLLSTFVKTLPEAPGAQEKIPAGLWGLIDYWIIASLSDSLSEEEGQELERAFKARFISDPLLARMANSFKFSPSVMRGTWRSERGRELARKMAFFQLTQIEFMRTPPQLLLYEKFKQELFDNQVTRQQDEVIWNAVEGVGGMVYDGKLDKVQLVQIGFAWGANVGLDGVLATFPPKLRAEFSYLMGRRYLKLNLKPAARRMFEVVAENASAESELKILANEELQRLGE